MRSIYFQHVNFDDRPRTLIIQITQKSRCLIRQMFCFFRHGKKVVIDMMGTDLYEPIFNVMEQIHPGLLKMILNKSIMEEEK